MKEIFLKSYMSIIEGHNPNLSQEQIDKFRYGIEGLYLTITKAIIIVVLGIILGIIKDVLFLLLFYNILRYFGFGYHAKNSKECLVTSIIFFVLLPLLVSKNVLIFKYNFILLVFCLTNFLLFAPSDTIKRPMINKKKKLIRKVLLISVSIFYGIIILTTKNTQLSSLLVLSLVIESIMVNPLIYKLTGQPYNNYKKYLSQN